MFVIVFPSRSVSGNAFPGTDSVSSSHNGGGVASGTGSGCPCFVHTMLLTRPGEGYAPCACYRRMTVELLSGGDMIARALEDEGVEYIFGYPGGAVLHIYDALF